MTEAWFTVTTQAQAQATYADAVTCLSPAAFVPTKGTNDQHVTASAYVDCAYACVIKPGSQLRRKHERKQNIQTQ